MSHETKNSTIKENRLFSEFPYPTLQEWREAAEKSLKGASFEEKLVTKTYEGILLQPMYTSEDGDRLPHLDAFPGSFPYVRGTEKWGYHTNPWEVCQELVYATPEEFNEAARHGLARGQTALHLAVDRAGLTGVDADVANPEDVGRGGVSICHLNDLGRALDGIDLEQVPLFINTGSLGLPVLALLVAHVRGQGKRTEQLRGCIGMDPLAALAAEGTLPCSMKCAYDTMSFITAWAKQNAPQVQTILVQANPYHDCGCHAVQELAFAIATGVEYMRELLQRGLSVDDVASRMRFSFSIGSHLFMEIAKFRAARMLWANAVMAFGGGEQAQKMHIHARTSAWTKTVCDPYVNMLRGTAEAFAGIIGGVNSLHVSAFDEAIGAPDEFSRRIARNTQLILRDEAHLAKVVDPAGGSWFIETLTDELAQKAWELFQEIERRGGMFRALAEGLPQRIVKDTAKQRADRIGLREDKIVGVNVYPDLREKPIRKGSSRYPHITEKIADLVAHRKSVSQEKLCKLLDALEETLRSAPGRAVDIAAEAASAGATAGEIASVLRRRDEKVPLVEPVHIHRGAEPFEALRAASEKYRKKTGALPKVFLAGIGPAATYKSRADFITGFFAAGGFEVVPNRESVDVEGAVREAIASDAAVVIICSSDEVYPELVPVFARKVKEANPGKTVLVAGKLPPEQLDLYRQAGVDDCVHHHTHCLEMLLQLQKQKGIGS